MSKLNKNTDYQVLVEKIGVVYQAAKKEVVSAVNVKMLEAYWQIEGILWNLSKVER